MKKNEHRGLFSRLFFGLFFDEWKKSSGEKTLVQNYLIDSILFIIAVILMIWFSLNNTFALTYETVESSWKSIDPYLKQDLKLFHKTFPNDFSNSPLIEYNTLKTVNEKVKFYNRLYTMYEPKLSEIIQNSTQPTIAKAFELNQYQRSVYSNEYNEHVRFFNYKLTDFPYSRVGQMKGFTSFQELQIQSEIETLFTDYQS